MRCAQVWAAAQGRNFVLPDDVKAPAGPVWEHRILIDPTPPSREPPPLASCPALSPRCRPRSGSLMPGEPDHQPAARRPAAGVPALLNSSAAGSRDRRTLGGSAASVILAAVTGSGWALCLIVLFSLILVWQLGWVEAGVVAIVGAVCLLVGIISVLGRFWYRVEIHLPNDRIQIGHTAMGELRVRNTRRRRVRAGVIEPRWAARRRALPGSFPWPPRPNGARSLRGASAALRRR